MPLRMRDLGPGAQTLKRSVFRIIRFGLATRKAV